MPRTLDEKIAELIDAMTALDADAKKHSRVYSQDVQKLIRLMADVLQSASLKKEDENGG